MNLRARIGGVPVWVIGAVAVIGGAIIIERRRKAAAAAANSGNVTSGSSADQYTSGYYAGEADASSMYSQLSGVGSGGAYGYGGSLDGGGQPFGSTTGLSGSATPSGLVTSDGTPPPAAAAAPSNAQTAGPTAPAKPAAFNPYPVGTIVAPNGEHIVQAIPTGTGWVDVTSLGGLYTSPGSYVTGSAIGAKAPAGGFTAEVSNGTVYENTAGGVKTFALK